MNQQQKLEGYGMKTLNIQFSKCRIFIFLIIFCSSVFSQEKERPPYPRSIIDIGIGVGTNYGIIGGQAVVGFKGSGLLLAAGTVGGTFLGQIGLQGSYNWLFVNACFGSYSVVQNVNTGSFSSLNGIIIMVGGKVNLIRSKKLYLQIGAGWAGGSGIRTTFEYIPISGPTATFGLGYRIAFNKKVKETVEK